MSRPRSGQGQGQGSQPEPQPQQPQALDWLDQLVDEIYAKMEEGEQANGFYHRKLHLTRGKLNQPQGPQSPLRQVLPP